MYLNFQHKFYQKEQKMHLIVTLKTVFLCPMKYDKRMYVCMQPTIRV